MIPLEIHPVMWGFLMLTVLSNLIFVEKSVCRASVAFKLPLKGINLPPFHNEALSCELPLLDALRVGTCFPFLMATTYRAVFIQSIKGVFYQKNF